MQVFADEGPSGQAIEKMLASLKDHDVVVVLLERKTANRFRQEPCGLDDVLAHAPSGIPIVMLGWLSPLMNADDPRWHAALGYPNITFRRLPEGVMEIMAALEEAAERKRTPDPLAIALLTAETTVREIGILHHDLDSAQRNGGERMEQWELHAQKLFGEKTQAELVEAVKRPRQDENATNQFAGQTFPDVCVDVEGTLFTEDGIFQPTILKYAERRAHAERRPITIWTGGDMEEARKLVRKAEIPYKLVSKHSLRGATVGIAIDDMRQTEFSKAYGVGYGEYHQI